uniref:Uncharacterized protein n=1 Tax=Chelydra serpentina TaxID=8475 RepID=A0A8C3TE24_CHESE
MYRETLVVSPCSLYISWHVPIYIPGFVGTSLPVMSGLDALYGLFLFLDKGKWSVLNMCVRTHTRAHARARTHTHTVFKKKRLIVKKTVLTHVNILFLCYANIYFVVQFGEKVP